MSAFSIPWGCLDGDKEQVSQPENPPKTHKTFVEALNNVCDIPNSQLPQPCVKGDDLAISISEDEYMVGIDNCKHNLHGRVVWSKGSTPLTVVALKNKLSPLWKDLARWGITSLDKGFYEFSFSSLLYGLAQEYWRPKILFAIASSVRTPICTDVIVAKPMFDRTFVHFARVLVDLDLSQTLSYRVLVERKGFAFYVEMEYENLPPFCTHCNMVGHYLNSCKWVQGFDDANQGKETKNNVKNKNESTGKYVKKKDGRTKQNKAMEVVNVEESINKTQNVNKEVVNVEVSTDNTVQNIPNDEPAAAIIRHSPLQPNFSNANTVDSANNNKFSALNTQFEEVESVEKGADLQGQFETEEVESRSKDVEFVEDTQQVQVVDKGEAQGSTQRNVSKEAQQDMQFLKESWANMAENEEDEIRLLNTLEKEPSFTVVTSKSSKKVKAKATKHSKSSGSYETRSKLNLDPVVISLDDQHVACSITVQDKVFGIAAIYASTCYIKRRLLWDNLSVLCNQYNISWCFMGDFNVIMGHHEYRGSSVPASLPMSEFQDWSNANDLLHLQTRGAWFTWSNGRRGRAFTEKRLDRAICNQSWLNSCSEFLKMWTLHESCKDIISNCWGTQIVGSPMFILSKKLKHLKDHLKIWNKEVFGNVHSFVKEAEDSVVEIQNQIQLNGGSDILRDSEKRALDNLDVALKRQEWMRPSLKTLFQISLMIG
ncbi:hypothetical protein TSUD_399030 [Trifolium subterraneum]|uniref:DUF4283 domain-containing protein n=1 Tax=Trifolium subterraneum TaxID=3900 RepID=A0A2Z6P311_TRISU|nr:hypothetical protein TSUD_399030 [Trifolium subterraneum]